MKKLVSILGALCMLCTAAQVLPVQVQQTAVISASASCTVCDNLIYTAYDDHVVIEGLDDYTAETAVIPAEINGLPVTVIADYSFVRSPFLKSVVFPDTLTEIGTAAFYECAALESVSFPESVRKIGMLAFRECTNLAEVTFNGTPEIETRAFENTAWENSESATELKKISGNFKYQISNDSVQITGTEEKIQGELVIPSEIDGLPVTSVEWDAFLNNTEMTSVILPDTLQSIKQSAFYGCTALTSVAIPANVTSIEKLAFAECTALETVTFAGDAPTMDKDVFYHTPWSTRQEGENNLLIVGDVLPQEGTYTIPEGKTEIHSGEYMGWGSMTSVIIPDSVTSIGDSAFYSTGLNSVEIPDSVTCIGAGAFELTDLQSVRLSANVTELEDNPFSRCFSLTKIEVEENNPCYCSIDGCLYSKDKKILICVPAGRTGTFTVPDGVTEIAVDAFSGCEKLTSVKLPESVQKIGTAAFYECYGLTSVNIPESVSVIENGAFLYCTALESVTIPESVKRINQETFCECWNLKKITILNPDCYIYPSRTTINGTPEVDITKDFGGIICGYSNSTAQQYAETFQKAFSSLGSKDSKNLSALSSENQTSQHYSAGDVDGSGKVNILDIITVNKALLGKENLTEPQLRAIDLNGNGEADSEDSLCLMKYIVGLIQNLSVQ